MTHVSLYRQDNVVCVNEAAAKRCSMLILLRSKSVSRFEMQVALLEIQSLMQILI